MDRRVFWVVVSLLLTVIVCGLFLYSINLRPLYTIEALLDASKSQVIRPVDGSLRNMDRSLRKLVWANYRINKSSSYLTFSQKIALLKSEDVLLNYILKYDLKPKLFAGRWDKKNRKWKKIKLSWFSRLVNLSSQSNHFLNNEPKNYKAISRLSKILRVKVSENSSLISIKLTWRDPNEGKKILDEFILFANNYILEKEKERVDRSIQIIDDLLDEENIRFRNVLINQKIQLKLSSFMNNPVLSSPFKSVVQTKIPEISMFRFPKVFTFLIFVISFFIAYFSISWLHRRCFSRLHLSG